MPLWGTNDGSDLTKTFSGSSGAATITMSGDVSAQVNVGEILVLDSDGTEKEHRITSVSSNGLTVGVDPVLTTAYTDQDVYVRQPPKYESAATIHSGVILGASEAEAQHATPGTLTHAGWVKKHSKTRSGVTSVWYETLVASSSITGDAEATDGLG